MSDAEYAKQLEIQRRAFEAQFGSLESMGFEDKSKQVLEEEESSQDEEEQDKEEDEASDSGNENQEKSEGEESESFEGFSEDETQPKKTPQRQPKVIKFGGSTDTYIPPSKKEQKLLRSGKAPKQTLVDLKAMQEAIEESKGKTQGDAGETENLENDLELQRFLKESHLLSAFGSGPSGADLTLETMDNVEYKDDVVLGKARSRTLEMRLQNLSATNGKNRKLEKVPMNIRRGMVDKHMKRIKKHENDAREGGIILSKVKKGEFRKIDSTYRKDIERRIGTKNASGDARRNAKRQRGLKVSSVGRSTRNGLIISSEEIKRINGDSGPGARGKKGKNGRR